MSASPIYTIKSGANAHPEATVLQFVTDLLKTSGILDVVNGTQFKVNQKTSPGMGVKVHLGRAYLLVSGGNGYPVHMDADDSTAVVVPANSSGNPRIDAVVLYANIGGTPATDGSGIALLMEVEGTPGASPSAPTDGAIQSTVGAGNPFIRLANLAVGAGVSTILDANITDTRTQVALRTDIINQDAWVPVSAVVGGTTNIDLSLGKKFQITMGAGNTTFALKNVPLIPKSILLKITQDVVGGRTVTWWGNLNWGAEGVPTLSTDPSVSDEIAINLLTVVSDSVNTSEGVVVKQGL